MPPPLTWETLPEWAGVSLDAAARERLRAFARLLAAAPRNVTRIRGEAEVLERHLLDALLGVPLLSCGAGASVTDVGSGGGVPGLPFAIARPDWRVLLVEATARKAEFIEDAAASLGLENVAVRAARAEDLGREEGVRESSDAVALRAVGRVATCLELGLPLVRAGGEVLLFRGPGEADAERVEAERTAPLLGGGAPRSVARRLPSGAERRLLVVPKLEPTPARYPRRPGLPAKRPLEGDRPPSEA